MYERIPIEMRSYRQWIVWRYEETDGPKPTKVPYSPHTHRPASVRKPDDWGSYDDCLAVLNTPGHQYAGLGFVLTQNDPYTFIDLDDSQGDESTFQRQNHIYKEFVSYAEVSPSGTGLHIIIRGEIPSGRKRGKIEIYSNARFMTMTGNVNRDLPITNYHELLNILYEQMSQGSNEGYYPGEGAQTQEDDEIVSMACTAVNGEKFYDLWTGNWKKHYQSQSEADMAIVDIIAFYTQNKEQIIRLFRDSGCGQREKAKRDDYVQYMLNKCFDRMLPPIDFDGLNNKLEEVIAESNKKKKPAPSYDSQRHDDDVVLDSAPLRDASECGIYTPPPGLMGEIAQFIYAAAHRPVPEIALVGAMGLMSGIVGRAYNISGTGLNTYTLLLAQTGVGKEAIATGTSRLMAHIQGVVPGSVDFIGPGDVASAQALTKYMSKGKNSFVSIVGEFGMYLQTMGSENAPPHMILLRRLMLDLFNKSGHGQSVRPSIYSDSEKNTNIIHAPNFSLIGESTPEKFYQGLHEGMISEGLIPRFTIIEYKGIRPPLNENAQYVKPSANLCQRMATLTAHCLAMNAQNRVINVQMCPDTTVIFRQFNIHCDARINNAASNMEIVRQLWNRAHVKALKLAATVAVGINPYDPIVYPDVAQWAIQIAIRDCDGIVERFNMGDIGGSDDEGKQLMLTTKALRDYVMKAYDELGSYVSGDGSRRLHDSRVIPYSYLHKKCAAVAAFRKDRQGSTAALKRTLRTLCERGDLIEIAKGETITKYNTNATCYTIADARGIGI